MAKIAKRLSKKFVEIKSKSSNGKVKIDCAFCKGEGETKTTVYPYKRTCPACKGSGEFLILKPSISCVFCGSTGREKKDPKVTCLVCKGSGANSVKRGYKLCKVCFGSGCTKESRLPCVSCKGTGAV